MKGICAWRRLPNTVGGGRTSAFLGRPPRGGGQRGSNPRRDGPGKNRVDLLLVDLYVCDSATKLPRPPPPSFIQAKRRPLAAGNSTHVAHNHHRVSIRHSALSPCKPDLRSIAWYGVDRRSLPRTGCSLPNKNLLQREERRLPTDGYVSN